MGKKKSQHYLNAAQWNRDKHPHPNSMSFDNQIIFLTAKTTESAIALASQNVLCDGKNFLLEMLADQFGHLEHRNLFFAAEDCF